MTANIGAETYRRWLEQNVVLTDLISPASLRELVLHLLLGRNYRVITEQNTKGRLLITYAWLIELYDRFRREYGRNWREGLLSRLVELDRPSSEEKNLMYWLVGLTKKTAQNLDIPLEELPDFLSETIRYCNELFTADDYAHSQEQAWLLLMAGAATLNIRGSQKSKVGKAIERVFLSAALSLLGLRSERDFWIGVPSDIEVARETDGEVETKRGRIRIDIGLIAQGNPEVITDKVNRVGRQGVVIFDKIGTHARVVYQSAEQTGVKLIQIRHNQPLLELYRHLSPLVRMQLRQPPSDERELKRWVDSLPDTLFEVTS
ncbi:hypothetical protein HKBW3S03_00054 [Candidatus Hakubella thermalkaliphila]|uniref:CfrBI restriction endonuclease n=1 Tax=Candidatus Hakubella thermalkaliphila TaxID=2754717 RepID=A0A6V8NE66_9ACTN|nr:CfrBI family restriction endonuclease [Candidatus Hakubella thermalkaliphila]GFP18549.1 hypothetical protein HKBW3S03_00054 [Candidatus Hakubella thermalkaliphila]